MGRFILPGARLQVIAIVALIISSWYIHGGELNSVIVAVHDRRSGSSEATSPAFEAALWDILQSHDHSLSQHRTHL